MKTMEVMFPKTKYPLSDKWLRQAFQWCSGAYFDGILSEPQEIKFCDGKSWACKDKDHHSDGHTGYFPFRLGGRTFLHVHADYRWHQSMAILILLHEMAHRKVGFQATKDSGHGYRFGAEITRLFEEGAYQGIL